MSIHYFTYDEEGVEFFKSLKELLNSPARKEDMYVYEGELDEGSYIDDEDDDYRETTAIDYLLKQNEELKETITDMEENCIQQEAVNDWINSNGQVVVDEDEIEELRKEIEELNKEAKKIEEAVRSSHGDALELCLPIWYGQDEDEDEEE